MNNIKEVKLYSLENLNREIKNLLIDKERRGDVRWRM